MQDLGESWQPQAIPGDGDAMNKTDSTATPATANIDTTAEKNEQEQRLAAEAAARRDAELHAEIEAAKAEEAKERQKTEVLLAKLAALDKAKAVEEEVAKKSSAANGDSTVPTAKQEDGESPMVPLWLSENNTKKKDNKKKGTAAAAVKAERSIPSSKTGKGVNGTHEARSDDQQTKNCEHNDIPAWLKEQDEFKKVSNPTPFSNNGIPTTTTTMAPQHPATRQDTFVLDNAHTDVENTDISNCNGDVSKSRLRKNTFTVDSDEFGAAGLAQGSRTPQSARRRGGGGAPAPVVASSQPPPQPVAMSGSINPVNEVLASLDAGGNGSRSGTFVLDL